ncbi:MAG: hypothetical protein CFE44_00815 [Burkholderiales bacterium PBB4]|nr:MAG: hypothetical protein CFE44_00815 [Burkholderiales bacterium PBB4]
MNKAVKSLITVVLLVAFGGAAYFSIFKTARLENNTPGAATGTGPLAGLAGKLTGTVPVEEVAGVIALDVEPYFQDPRVQKRLADLGYRLKTTRIGSRDMAGRVVKDQTPEFLYASGVVAGNQIVDAAKKAGVPATMVSPIYTPMVIASWTPIAKILAANGMAAQRQDGVWTVDMAKLTQAMLDKKRWKDLQAAKAYDVNKSVLVSTTDVRKSNSAAMYLALTTYAVNGNEMVTDRDAALKAANTVLGLFKRQGYQENYVNGNFDDYATIGIGKTPMAFIYENQMVSYAIGKRGLGDSMVLLVPQPTLFNKVVFVATSDRAKKLGELLSTDTELQHLAVAFGFRIAEGAYFAQTAKSVGLTIDEQITQVIDPPSFELMTQMIDTISQGMAQ